MAKHSARQTVQKDSCENPKIKEIVSKKLLDQLMNAVKIEAVMGETIVSMGPIKESPCPELYAVSFERSVRLTPLIRCRECEHYNAGFECLIEGYGIERPADYFCADGKRKNGGQDDD